jgi:methionyl-tRNA formyltransferase
VDWINGPQVLDLLKQKKPDLTIIICTSILSKEVLEAAGTVINVHGGFLPYYRGNHCFFFALYRRDFDKIGSTIHFVDVGIDTGNIVEVVVPPIHPSDNAEMLYCRAEKIAIHRLVEWLEFDERGGVLPRRAHVTRTPLNRTRDRKLYHDVLLWFRRMTGRFVVPELPAPPREISPLLLEQAGAQQARTITVSATG